MCDDYFDSNDARVACTQLGYYYHYTYSTGFGGYGVGSIWMDNMGCSGAELSLFDCPGIIGSSSCSHYEDIGVRCYCKCALLLMFVCNVILLNSKGLFIMF